MNGVVALMHGHCCQNLRLTVMISWDGWESQQSDPQPINKLSLVVCSGKTFHDGHTPNRTEKI